MQNETTHDSFFLSFAVKGYSVFRHVCGMKRSRALQVYSIYSSVPDRGDEFDNCWLHVIFGFNTYGMTFDSRKK